MTTMTKENEYDASSITVLEGLQAVRERYWITYQPGEIRTCAVCHGLNTQNQTGGLLPTNSPAALHDLLLAPRLCSEAGIDGLLRIPVHVAFRHGGLLSWQRAAAPGRVSRSPGVSLLLPRG